MGLDMYLYANTFISGVDYSNKDGEFVSTTNPVYTQIVDILGAHDYIRTDLPSVSVKVKVAYWRKDNQIHNWFVANVQNGVDECQNAYASRDKLQELVDTCTKVLADHSLAEALLPTGAGFFFGSTDYDEYYYGALQETVDMISKVLENAPDSIHFEYQSSW